MVKGVYLTSGIENQDPFQVIQQVSQVTTIENIGTYKKNNLRCGRPHI